MSDHRILTFASVECFTHCEIGIGLHKLSAPYVENRLPVSVSAVMFLPSVYSIEEVLGIRLPAPKVHVNGVKVYDENGNMDVALILSKALKEKIGVDISVASSAGNGRGIVCLRFNNKVFMIRTTNEVKNFPFGDAEKVYKRKEEAVDKTLRLLKALILGGDIPDFVEVLSNG
ncbi:FeGP cofactor biosynthesis protein HcgF family protein [Desulfurobacterium sp.]